MEALVILAFFAIWAFFAWLFYLWGAAIAEGKGRPRSLGWWAVFFGLAAILVLALLPSVSVVNYAAPRPEPKTNLSTELERLAALKDRGALTEDEFAERKRRLLQQS